MRYIYRRLSGRKDDVSFYDCIEMLAAHAVVHRPILCQLSSLQTFFPALLMRRKMSVLVDLLNKKIFCVAEINWLFWAVSMLSTSDNITMATCAGSGK